MEAAVYSCFPAAEKNDSSNPVTPANRLLWNVWNYFQISKITNDPFGIKNGHQKIKKNILNPNNSSWKARRIANLFNRSFSDIELVLFLYYLAFDLNVNLALLSAVANQRRDFIEILQVDLLPSQVRQNCRRGRLVDMVKTEPLAKRLYSISKCMQKNCGKTLFSPCWSPPIFQRILSRLNIH